jgi:hypothetical protein
MAEQSAYTILNIRKGATDEEIKRAYIELVKRYDPEMHAERFMIIQNAYERLRDPSSAPKKTSLPTTLSVGSFHFRLKKKKTILSPISLEESKS